jgi:hypothetical protein
MNDALNWLVLIAASALTVMAFGLIARLYWWIFMVGWGLL